MMSEEQSFKETLSGYISISKNSTYEEFSKELLKRDWVRRGDGIILSNQKIYIVFVDEATELRKSGRYPYNMERFPLDRNTHTDPEDFANFIKSCYG